MSAHRVLVVGAAPEPGGDDHYRDTLAGASRAVAADAAGEWCVRLGRVPDVVVGDFDSSDEGAAERLGRAGVEVITLPVSKDVSDLEECLAEVRRRGWSGVDVCAAFWDRIDHTLASIGAVLACADLDVRIVEPSWTGWVLDGTSAPSLKVDLAQGTVFSVIAPAGAAGVTITGAEYPLSGHDLPPLSALGLSNVATGEGPVRVSLGSGRGLVTALR